MFDTGVAVADQPVGTQLRSSQTPPSPLSGGIPTPTPRPGPPTPMALWSSKGHHTPVKPRYTEREFCIIN